MQSDFQLRIGLNLWQIEHGGPALPGVEIQDQENPLFHEPV